MSVVMDTLQQEIFTQEAFSEYEKRFMRAMLKHPQRKPWEKHDREEIILATKKCLGIRDEWFPVIHDIQVLREHNFGTFKMQTIRFQSWDNFYGTASLYLPQPLTTHAAIVLCCGHGEEGRQTDGYQALPQRLAQAGAVVLCPDNIGQGARRTQGHRCSVGPFYCGTSVQGLIVLETIAWIRRLAQFPFVDAARLGAVGNSGGGTLTLFLGALCPELASLCSCGYPSIFAWLGAKEKRHCHCNIIPHSLENIEMWELYSVFAPKPLFLEQGALDHLLPVDLFYKNARNVKTTYTMLGAEENFRSFVSPDTHPLSCQEREEIVNFFSDTLGIARAEHVENDMENILPVQNDDPPAGSMNLDALAQSLTGVTMPENTCLWDVFVPTLYGQRISPDMVVKEIKRGEVMQILAQFEAFL